MSIDRVIEGYEATYEIYVVGLQLLQTGFDGSGEALPSGADVIDRNLPVSAIRPVVARKLGSNNWSVSVASHFERTKSGPPIWSRTPLFFIHSPIHFSDSSNW